MDDLTALPNIGEKLAHELEAAGISGPEQLRAIGSVEAVLRITAGASLTGYNMLYAVEGAIRGLRWHSIPKAELRAVREEYDRAQSAQCNRRET